MSNDSNIKTSNKVVFGMLMAVIALLSFIIYGWTQFTVAQQSAQNREFNLKLENLSQTINQRVETMKLIAKITANDTHIHDWVEQGFNSEQEALLIKKLGFLVNEYSLTSASFADTNTHKYWNHEGFLRVLEPEIDTWYFAYLASEKQDLISVYHDKNQKRIDIYVNYRQADGKGLSGIATSFDGMLNLMKTFPLAEGGEIYLVDAMGNIQVHNNPEVMAGITLQSLYSNEIASNLLQSNSTQVTEYYSKEQGSLAVSYIPSMKWYVVVSQR